MDVTACSTVKTSGGQTYTVARLGGGDHIDVESSAYANCTIGIYISPSNGPVGLNHTIVNGQFGIGIYVDSVGTIHQDNTSICINGTNSDGMCTTGSASSPGTGLDFVNTPNLSIDHTNIDGYVAGFATNPCPNSANNITDDHTVITNATYPWSYEGGKLNFNFQPGHDSPPFNGESCAGSEVGSGLPPGGNVYVADFSDNALKEILAVGGYTNVTTVSTAINLPDGIAVDANANVYTASYVTNAVYEILAAGGYTTVKTLGSGFKNPAKVVLDANDNVYVADGGNGAVKEILAASGYTTVNTLGSGFVDPIGIAVDANANVYVADNGTNTVKEILAAGGYTTVKTLGSGFVQPYGVAVDANANVYVAEAGTGNAVKEILAAGGYTTVNTLFSGDAAGYPDPWDVAVDAEGNVYVANYHSIPDADAGSVYEILAVDGSIPPSPTIVTLGSGFANLSAIAIQYSAVAPGVRRNHHKTRTK